MTKLQDARNRLTPWLDRFDVIVDTPDGERLAGHVSKEKKMWRATGRSIGRNGETIPTHHGDHWSRSDAVGAVEAFYLAHYKRLENS